MTTTIKKTNEEMYLEWLNNYLSTERMAKDYGMNKKELEKMIDKGRDEHLQKFESEAYKQFWLKNKLN